MKLLKIVNFLELCSKRSLWKLTDQITNKITNQKIYDFCHVFKLFIDNLRFLLQTFNYFAQSFSVDF